jgi:hydrogenase maturation protease
MRRPIVVLGLGNLLMADEGVGVAIVQSLTRKAAGYPEVDFVDAGTGGLAVLHELDGRSKAVFVDCAFMGQTPGTIRRFTPDQVASVKPILDVSGHEGDPLRIVEMARTLGQCPAEVVFFGIEPERVEPGMGLSDSLKARWPEYMGLISKELT